MSIVGALLLDARGGRPRTRAAEVVLDASESWLRGADSTGWKAALDSASRLTAAGELPVKHFGDSLRVPNARSGPIDHASGLRSVVDAASATGSPLVVITDGELEDAELLRELPRGSRTLVIPRRTGPDAAVDALDAPQALMSGDTLLARVTIVSGASGAGAGQVRLQLDDSTLDTIAFTALPPYTERSLLLRGVAKGPDRAAVLEAIVQSPGDREPRNDTLALGVDVTRSPAALFVSTTPDYDSREAVAALRGVTSLPTRAYYRVAPGMWRSDAGLVRVDEATVKEAARDAPMVILHGDTAIFGAPRSMTRGSLLLFAPPAADEGEWYAFGAPASPIAPMLGQVPFDSLAPLSVSRILPQGEWQGLATRRGGAPEEKRLALVGWESPRRIAVLGASGFWRWRFRGGVKADAYATFFGALYDWLAAGRVDRRMASPDGAVAREGLPVRWRGGGGGDSTVHVILQKRGAGSAPASLSLQFRDGAQTFETPALSRGTYDVTAPGGKSVLVVNASRELVPRAPSVRSSRVGGEPSMGDAPALRDFGWIYVLAVLALCAEWLLRRQAGLR